MSQATTAALISRMTKTSAKSRLRNLPMVSDAPRRSFEGRLRAGDLHPDRDELARPAAGDVGGPPVGPAEADVRGQGHRRADVDLQELHDLALGRDDREAAVR